MKLAVNGIPSSAQTAVDLLAAEWDLTVTSTAAVQLTVAQGNDGLRISRAADTGTIQYSSAATLLRGLTEWLAHAQNELHFDYQEKAPAAKLGLFLDQHGAARLNDAALRQLLRRAAMLGYDQMLVATMPGTDYATAEHYAHLLGLQFTVTAWKREDATSPLIGAVVPLYTNRGLAPNQGRLRLTATTPAGDQDMWAAALFSEGAETPAVTLAWGLQMVAEYHYQTAVTPQWVAAQFWLMQHEDADGFLALDQFDNFKRRGKANREGSNPSKILFYMDWLYPRFWHQFGGVDAEKHYRVLADKLASAVTTQQTRPMYTYYHQLALYLSRKAHVLQALTDAYRNDDHDEMTGVISELTVLADQLDELHDAYWQMWRQERTTFGWHTMDSRFGGLKQRLATTIDWLNDWQTGQAAPLVSVPDQPGKLGFATYGEIVAP